MPEPSPERPPPETPKQEEVLPSDFLKHYEYLRTQTESSFSFFLKYGEQNVNEFSGFFESALEEIQHLRKPGWEDKVTPEQRGVLTRRLSDLRGHVEHYLLMLLDHNKKLMQTDDHLIVSLVFPYKRISVLMESLREIDADLSSKLEPHVVSHFILMLSKASEGWEKLPPDQKTLEAYRHYFEILYRILSLQFTPESEEKCRKAITNLEGDMRLQHGNSYKKFIRDKLSQLALPARPEMEQPSGGVLPAQAMENTESAGLKKVRDYELPDNRIIRYVRIFPKTQDILMPEGPPMLHYSAIKASLLQDRYSNLFPEPIIFSDNPVKELRQLVKDGIKDGMGGPFCYVFDFYSHGTPESLGFNTRITALDLALLCQEDVKDRFIISTIACHGGGLRDQFLKEFQTNPALAKRVDLFLQTKPDVSNVIALIAPQKPDSKSDLYGTHYELHFMNNLSRKDVQGKYLTYGTAHWVSEGWLEANTVPGSPDSTDRGVKVNPEALIEGELYPLAPVEEWDPRAGKYA